MTAFSSAVEMVWRWPLVTRRRSMRSLMQYRTARERQSYACFTITLEMRWVYLSFFVFPDWWQ